MNLFSALFLFISITIYSCTGINKEKIEITKEYVSLKNIYVEYLAVSEINDIQWENNIPKYFHYVRTLKYKCESDFKKEEIIIYFNKPNKCNWRNVSVSGETIKFKDVDGMIFAFDFKPGDWYALDYGNLQWKVVFTFDRDTVINIYRISQPTNF
jgi:hypothetical protein